MDATVKPQRFWNAGCVFALLLLLVFLLYSNTMDASWKFDDFPNIVNNPRLHLTELRSEKLIGTLFADPKGGAGLYRPVSCLSLALNWYFGRQAVFGYHLVNLTIHVFTAFFLYLTVACLHRTPRLVARFSEFQVQLVAALTAIFWVVNPIHTQAVNYVVQRMALLAALFTIMGLYFYVKARLSPPGSTRRTWGGLCLLSFFLAIGSKENAFLFPLSVFLVEAVFFKIDRNRFSRSNRMVLAVTAMVILACGLLIFGDGNPFFFLNGYAGRPFTFTERLLTQPRILVFYLSQIFYPLPDRLSIEHDVQLSENLLHPWTTLPAIALVAFLIGWSIISRHKYPIPAFACLFFFVNHLVESSVIPLELIFEHRNYLPSLFLFWPVALGVRALIGRFRQRYLARYTVVVWVFLLLIGIGLGTHARNAAWATEESLWTDAMEKAPRSGRPYQSLAVYYERVGQLDKSMAMLEKSKGRWFANPKVADLVYYNNMGHLLIRKGRYEDALPYLETLLQIEPYHFQGLGNSIKALIRLRRWQQAADHIDILLQRGYRNARIPILKGVVLSHQNRVSEALQYFGRAYALAPYSREAVLNLGSCLGSLGQFDRGLAQLKRGLVLFPEDPSVLIRMIENRVRSGDLEAARGYLTALRRAAPGLSIQEILGREAANIYLMPPDPASVSAAAAEAASQLNARKE